jgi:hypothetical protein
MYMVPVYAAVTDVPELGGWSLMNVPTQTGTPLLFAETVLVVRASPPSRRPAAVNPPNKSFFMVPLLYSPKWELPP